MTRQGIWKRLLTLVAILMVGSFILAACGDDDDDEDPTNTAGSGQSAATNTIGATESSGTAAMSEPTATEAMAGETATKGDDEEFDFSDLSGEINVDGSSTVFPVAQAAAEEFIALAPDVSIAVNSSGTGGGFEKFCAGGTDISNASRPISEEEIALCEAEGVEYTEFQVGVDGISIIVHTENDWVEC
ncbi:MAG: substrate-binding domain-containing protein, partial [Vicinamibacterales bacterium]